MSYYFTNDDDDDDSTESSEVDYPLQAVTGTVDRRVRRRIEPVSESPPHIELDFLLDNLALPNTDAFEELIFNQIINQDDFDFGDEDTDSYVGYDYDYESDNSDNSTRLSPTSITTFPVSPPPSPRS